MKKTNNLTNEFIKDNEFTDNMINETTTTTKIGDSK